MEKYLSIRSLIKHICSWRGKLIILWALDKRKYFYVEDLKVASNKNPVGCKTVGKMWLQQKWILQHIHRRTTRRLCQPERFHSLLSHRASIRISTPIDHSYTQQAWVQVFRMNLLSIIMHITHINHNNLDMKYADDVSKVSTN